MGVISWTNLAVVYLNAAGAALDVQQNAVGGGGAGNWGLASIVIDEASYPAGTSAVRIRLWWASTYSGSLSECPVGSLISTWYDDVTMEKVP
jgi:hypothetical protein